MKKTELELAVEAEEALSVELENYVNQWVAVSNHHVVASAETLSELRQDIEHNKVEVEGVFQVVDGPCFFESLSQVHAILDNLKKVGTREIPHLYLGMCPDETDGFDRRDPNCPACQILTEGKSDD